MILQGSETAKHRNASQKWQAHHNRRRRRISRMCRDCQISYKIVFYWLAALASARLPNRQADAGDSAKHFNETVLLQTWNGNSLGDMCFCWKPDRTRPSSVGSPAAKQANKPLPGEGELWWSVVHRAPFQENQEHRMTSKQACCPCLYSSITSVMNCVLFSVQIYPDNKPALIWHIKGASIIFHPSSSN